MLRAALNRSIDIGFQFLGYIFIQYEGMAIFVAQLKYFGTCKAAHRMSLTKFGIDSNAHLERHSLCFSGH